MCLKVILYVSFSIYTAAFYVWPSAYTAALHHPTAPTALDKYNIPYDFNRFADAQEYSY